MISNIICSQYNIQNQTRPAASGGQPLLTQPSLSAPKPDTDRFSLAHFAGPKLGDSYTKSDVLNQLWKEAHTINLNDPNATGGLCFDPTEEDLARLAQQAEARGLDGQMDFSKISSDFSKTLPPAPWRWRGSSSEISPARPWSRSVGSWRKWSSRGKPS